MLAETVGLMLVCIGGGTMEKGDFGEDKRDRPFSDQVDVEINGTKGRIRMPRSMLHWIAGGSDGWVKLRKLRINDRSIDGLASTNIFDMPRVRIDRMTGMISIVGNEGSFSGTCEAVEASTERKF